MRRQRCQSFRVVRAVPAGLLGLVLLSGCDDKNAYVSPPPPAVDVAKPVSKPVERYLTASGTTAAVNSTSLVARVQGFVEKISYTDGAAVKAGQKLFVIEQEPYRLALQQSQAAEAGARATAKQSQETYLRQSDLVARKVASQQDLDNAAAQRDADQAKLQQAEADTKQAELNLGYTEVKAPFDGIVTARQVSVGELVGAGGAATVLATIVQLDPIYADFSFSEVAVQRVRAEMARRGMTTSDLRKVPVELGLESDKGYPHAGMLDYVSPTVSSGTGTLSVRGVFKNPGDVLLPGYFVRVRVPLGPAQDRLLVPDRALGSDQSGRYLLVLGKDDKVEQRPVSIGQLVGELRVIETGLEPDDKVLVSGLMTAVPGETVDPKDTTIASGGAAGE